MVPIFLLASRKSLEARLSMRGMAGILLSIAVPVLLVPEGPTTRWSLRGPGAPVFEIQHTWSIFVVSIGYTLMLIAAYWNLGRNLSVTPTLKSVVTHGLYSVVRHPVYAATLHIVAIFTLVFPSATNLLCLASLNAGLYLRMMEEEIVLTGDDSYVAYMAKMKYRTYSPVVSSPLIFLITLRLLSS
jgi:protein-S-isoprenylcysteine O-methyltransferase Ste14